ncbi:MAG: hypothetical protein ACNA8K_07760 [Cyclonatronaceae bacterium]
MKIVNVPFYTSIAVLMWVIWLLPVAVYSQFGIEIFRHISLLDGLTSNLIWKMKQDSKGYIWIAGANGPGRYDSYNVTSFIHDPGDETSYSGGPSFSFFLRTTTDSYGSVQAWASTCTAMQPELLPGC